MNSTINEGFVIKKISPTIGSTVYGLDLSKPIPKETLKKLRHLWLDRKLLVFPEQTLTPKQQTDFTQQFGELDQYPFLEGIKGHPYVAEVLKRPEEKINFGGVWHADTTYLETPAAGASLYALELPPIGGDTIFCNMGAAYQALTDKLKQTINPLKAFNASNKPNVSQTRLHRITRDALAKQVFINSHPVVRTHPETGEKTLFVNEAHTTHFTDQSEQQSKALLNELYQHARKPEFQCRITWHIGMVALWDNRSTHHYPINDYTGYRRLLHRVSLKGDKPF